MFQDELIPLWRKKYNGKSVQHSVLGRVKSKLLLKDNSIVLSSSLPTTKFCKECGKYNDIGSNPIYKCTCGVKEDRDIHAANNMIWFYENKVGVGRTKFKRGEI